MHAHRDDLGSGIPARSNPSLALNDEVLPPSSDDGSLSKSEQSVENLMAALDQMRTSSPHDPHSDYSRFSDSNSEPDEFEHEMDLNQTNECTGVLVEWSAGSVWDTYPYHQHGTQDLAWEPIGFTESDKWLRIRSKSCRVILAGDSELNSRCCSECAKVPHSAAFTKFRKRAVDASEHTPWLYLTYQQLHAVLVKLSSQYKALRLKHRNLERKLAVAERKLLDHDHIIKLLATHDVCALRRLLTVAIKNGASVSALFMQLQMAIQGLYSPRGHASKRDYDIAFLAKALGGPRLLYALAHAIGIPSNSTLVQNHKVPVLLPSIAKPTADETEQNISSMFDPDVKPAPSYVPSEGEKLGQVAMIDGVALDAVDLMQTTTAF